LCSGTKQFIKELHNGKPFGDGQWSFSHGHLVSDSQSVNNGKSGSTMASQSMTIIGGAVMISYGRPVKDSQWSMMVISH